MERREIEESSITQLFICICDIVLLCLSLTIAYHALAYMSPAKIANISLGDNIILAILCYLPLSILIPPILLRRIVRSDRIVERIVRLTVLQLLLYSAVEFAIKGSMFPRLLLFYFFLIFTLFLVIERLSLRGLVKHFRAKGHNQHFVVLVGDADELCELAQRLQNQSYGYRIVGLFTNKKNEEELSDVPRLGSVNEVMDYLKAHHHITDLYCAIAGIKKAEIFDLYSYCENHGVRFYALPAYLSSLRRNMVMSHVGNTMLLSSRREPLRDFGNSITKRALDVIVSGIFLVTIFPIVYVIAAICIKCSSPGPVFFKQQRNGYNGKVFNCFKFRSMHVNKDADKIQATEHDPRKFKFGDLMRRTNIDELPQFINVFRGDMSLVGPRPHMLLHTEEYSQLINKYMVRHWVKPGITGWAQVQGFRGETKELSQMEARVHADIWYVEHWTFWLDLRIMWLTVWNTIRHNEANAY